MRRRFQHISANSLTSAAHKTLAARIRSAGNTWDYGDPGMTGVIGWGEFMGYRLVGTYLGSGENGAGRCARHAMGVANHPDASLVITVDSSESGSDGQWAA